jgi:hypothetical protein
VQSKHNLVNGWYFWIKHFDPQCWPGMMFEVPSVVRQINMNIRWLSMFWNKSCCIWWLVFERVSTIDAKNNWKKLDFGSIWNCNKNFQRVMHQKICIWSHWLQKSLDLKPQLLRFFRIQKPTEASSVNFYAKDRKPSGDLEWKTEPSRRNKCVSCAGNELYYTSKIFMQSNIYTFQSYNPLILLIFPNIFNAQTLLFPDLFPPNSKHLKPYQFL